ncbi:MAG TPA: L,D-transpeptidase family protein [Gaiellaceae bacterium]|nr:L,D-transpeptidase family protein [Gaiellaceae bacterium]
MKRGFLVALFAFGFVVAGACSGVAMAESSPSSGGKAPAVAHVPKLAAGVRIAGIRVSNLDASGATAAVRAAFAKPLPITIDGTTVTLSPTSVATPYIAAAVAHARSAAPGTNIQLVVSPHGDAVRAYVAKLAKRFDTKATDEQLTLRGGNPVIKPAQNGTKLPINPVVAGIERALTSNTRLPLHFTSKKTTASVGGTSTGTTDPVIVINRSLNRLSLYNGSKLTRRFSVATGQAIYPTPAGEFHIIVKWVNPTWYPPTQDAWAKGLKPVPPGPDNPLGTRWMGLSSPGIGIHGTDEPTSIGYSESHGCVRMEVPDAEWLFNRVNVGTPVFIV